MNDRKKSQYSAYKQNNNCYVMNNNGERCPDMKLSAMTSRILSFSIFMLNAEGKHIFVFFFLRGFRSRPSYLKNGKTNFGDTYIVVILQYF